MFNLLYKEREDLRKGFVYRRSPAFIICGNSLSVANFQNLV
jgi:hypothetical protein